MEDESLTQSFGPARLPPVSLTPEQRDLCARLDDLHGKYSLKAKASDMFAGALFAARAECRSNPDWVAQAANSLREILYPFWSPGVPCVSDKKAKALRKYGSVFVDEDFIQEIGTVYGQLQNLTHHGSRSEDVDITAFRIEDFEKLLTNFQRVMREALTRQVDVHRDIDRIIAGGPERIAV